MKAIIITNQRELNDIPNDFQGIIEIHNNKENLIVVNRSFQNSLIELRGNSSAILRGNSSAILWENSFAELWGNSSAILRGNSYAILWGNSSAILWENSSAILWAKSSAKLCGWSQARIMSRYAKYETLNNARVILPFQSVSDYVEYFNIQEDGDDLILYKAVHRDTDSYFYSDHDYNFHYKVGMLAVEPNIDRDIDTECSSGINVSHLQWALSYGRGWGNLAIIECRVPKDKCVIPAFSDGKIRTSELMVIREVPREEWGMYGKIIRRGQ